ncbi:hypothetical protein O1611_g1425 [Lasiodiplodia mahajangana]|uniref:Uncharacterized protein n=1 Tax=Lasiodiplodia mahajangana TaxID=1108764 RepID=A0ACC2JXM5_9PEZI|nr:hypothetical protein O1611_g1425 [Lasiodiplodia mahajangana]
MSDFEKSSTAFIAAAKNALSSQDEGGRKKLLAAAMQATAMLEDPADTVWRIIMSPHAPAALMALIKAGVIEEIAKSDSPTSADHLSKVSGAERLLIVRLLRPLNALGFVKETSPEVYAPTLITKALVDRALLGGYQFMFSAATRSLANLPFYLEKTGFKNVSGAPGPFQDAHHTEDNMFPWLIKDPPMMGNFNAFMTGQRADRKQWFDILDVHDILLTDAKKDANAPLLIDVGGGEGHDIAEFQKRYPDAPGRLILQDTPPVIDSIQDLTPKVERQKHDFFLEQPIQGARCYYFRSILHDWPDAECIKILKITAAAMAPGYSKLLLSEFVLPSKNTPLYPALLDVNMMAVLNGMERTEAQFTELLDAAGLRVVRFWSIGSEVEGLVEAVFPPRPYEAKTSAKMAARDIKNVKLKAHEKFALLRSYSVMSFNMPAMQMLLPSDHLPLDVNRGPGLVAAAWALGVIGSSLLVMRLYTRAFIIKKIGWDDWTMVITVVLALVADIIVTLMVHYGVGRHTVYLEETQRVNAVYMIWLSVPFSPGSAAAGKISIALLLRRLTNRNRWQEAALWVLISLLIIVNLILIIITFSQCTPVTFLWNRVGSGFRGTCWSPAIQQDYGYFQGAFSAFSDSVLALFPILIIWNLKMSLHSKLIIIFLMSLGIIATVAAAVKTLELRNLATPDFTWDAVPLVYWFLAENWIIIVCACVPTVKPLIVNSCCPFKSVALYAPRQPNHLDGHHSYYLEPYERIQEP